VLLVCPVESVVVDAEASEPPPLWTDHLMVIPDTGAPVLSVTLTTNGLASFVPTVCDWLLPLTDVMVWVVVATAGIATAAAKRTAEAA
jgi:hypothetical protein